VDSGETLSAALTLETMGLVFRNGATLELQ
jgi:hypothetical protein